MTTASINKKEARIFLKYLQPFRYRILLISLVNITTSGEGYILLYIFVLPIR